MRIVTNLVCFFVKIIWILILNIRNLKKIVNIWNVEFVKTCGDQLTNTTTIIFLIKIYKDICCSKLVWKLQLFKWSCHLQDATILISLGVSGPVGDRTKLSICAIFANSRFLLFHCTCYRVFHGKLTNLPNFCPNDELSSSWVGCLLTDSVLPDTWKLREWE